MKERPILMNGPMARATILDIKTHTRRVVKPAPEADQILHTIIGSSGFIYSVDQAPMIPYPAVRRIRWDCPYGQPGDRLWVRESGVRSLLAGGGEQAGLFRHDVPETPETGRYWVERTRGPGASYNVAGCTRAAALLSQGSKVTPSIHMPRWASRILLEIVSVRVERLNDISEADALAEGIKFINGRYTFNDGLHESRTAKEAFKALWESINGAGSWDANQFVWVVEFTRIPMVAA